MDFEDFEHMDFEGAVPHLGQGTYVIDNERFDASIDYATQKARIESASNELANTSEEDQRRTSECVRSLLDAGAYINHVTTSNKTPLMYVCAVGDVDLVRSLVNARADLNYGTGRSALMICSDKCHVECARALLEAGAQVDKTSRGRSAIRYATTLEMVQLLCSYGASRQNWLPGRCDEAWTWFEETKQWVSQLHHVEFLPPVRVRELLRAGDDIYSSDGEVDAPTPLSIAQSLIARAGFEHHDGAKLIVSAAEPWSRHTHELFPLEARRRAVELQMVGQLLAKQPMFANQEMAFLDVWTHVMAYAVTRSC